MCYFHIETFHIRCLERNPTSGHLVNYTAKGPDIGLVVVGFVLPNFRGGVVRCASLGSEETLLDNFRNIEVCEFCSSMFIDENIGGFYVTVHHVEIMERLETTETLKQV